VRTAAPTGTRGLPGISGAQSFGPHTNQDFGLSGALGPADQQLRLSDGSGPYTMDNNKNKLITRRIAPTLPLDKAGLTVGPSGARIGTKPARTRQ
jgi:hypothetical protein